MSYYSDAILADSPQVFYRLNESSGPIAFDLTSHANNGTYSVGTETFGQAGPLVDVSSAAVSFGINDTLTFPTSLNTSMWSALTLIFWIKISGGWHMVAVAVDATSTICYLDGTVTTPGTGSGDLIVIDQNITYAGNGAASTVAEVSLFQYKMSGTEIAHFYSVGITNRTGVARFPATARRNGLFLTTSRRNGLFRSTARRGS